MVGTADSALSEPRRLGTLREELEDDRRPGEQRSEEGGSALTSSGEGGGPGEN